MCIQLYTRTHTEAQTACMSEGRACDVDVFEVQWKSVRAFGHKASIGGALPRPRGGQFLVRQRRAEASLWCSRSPRKVSKQHIVEGTPAGPHAAQLLIAEAEAQEPVSDLSWAPEKSLS